MDLAEILQNTPIEDTVPSTPVQLGYFESIVISKYPHLETADIISIVDKAKMFYYSAKFPCEPYADETTRPITSFVAKNWVIACCDELIDRLGFSSATAYKENGVSWSFDNAQISDRLLSMITPVVGVI